MVRVQNAALMNPICSVPSKDRALITTAASKKNIILNGRTIGSAMTALDNIKKNAKVYKTMILQGGKIYKHNATDEIIKFLYHNHKNN